MRHRFHSICPYFAMFPESFVEKHLAASQGVGVVFDPFCGRGTTVFQALLDGRVAAGCDVNPVAHVISRAKCDPPSRTMVLKRIRELSDTFHDGEKVSDPGELHEFFELCFHEMTRSQVLFLRSNLDWRRSKVDCFISAMALGSLHGESHRSGNYFSNRMPRTISTKPRYSVRWWRERGYTAPKRDTFEILAAMTDFRFATPPTTLRGDIRLLDARKAGKAFLGLRGKVSDIVTSPPYLDTTHYIEDQWLRLWFLGEPARMEKVRGDHRHTSEDLYWAFLEDVWRGVTPLLAPITRFVVRIGGRRINADIARQQLKNGLEVATKRQVRFLDAGVTSEIRKNQANVFRGKAVSKSLEHDFCMEIT